MWVAGLPPQVGVAAPASDPGIAMSAPTMRHDIVAAAASMHPIAFARCRRVGVINAGRGYQAALAGVDRRYWCKTHGRSMTARRW